MPVAAGYLLAVACGPLGAWAAMQTGLALPGSACGASALLILLLAAPVLEESIFRGGLHAWLARRAPARLGCLSLANLVVAGVFGAMHAIHQQSSLMLLSAAPALMMGWVWELSGARLLAPVLLHAWYNLCIVVLSCYRSTV